MLLSVAPALAEEYTGKVVGITDSDTFSLLTPEKRQLQVRLAEDDTPERSQACGGRARQALSDLAFNRQALAEFERELIRERTIAGLAAARVRPDEGPGPPCSSRHG